MPEPVSPADTIRRANAVYETISDADLIGEIRRRYNNQPSLPVLALCERYEALLAVGERDKAELENALHGKKLAELDADNERRILGETLAERERDRRQIARLTEALKRAAQGPCLNTMRVGGCAALIDRKKFCPSCTARAVLADEEDAANGRDDG